LLEDVMPLMVRGSLLTLRSERIEVYNGERLMDGPEAAGLIFAANIAGGL